MMTMTTTIT
ncbi:Protein of unknown function [Bacillus wiedmannii]|uniref:Uncharacterized protein n=2 Tax=Bacillus cereus group TaxID=86661 RepID=A0A1C4CYY6_BACTU|nr:Protein of unknown function [Bacillus wiedmannii]SCC24279.1 Protein of unknown function [Bacillus thuringiensis]SCL93768.1 Protein of unknown function [Bacillus wiedmannii]SCN07631.1 Protein of unknown function [Bacillus wiedmannii]